MFAQDAPNFQDRVGVALGGMTGVDDQFRFHSINMRAFVGNDSIVFSNEWETAS
jgi:hypothetical protein